MGEHGRLHEKESQLEKDDDERANETDDEMEKERMGQLLLLQSAAASCRLVPSGSLSQTDKPACNKLAQTQGQAGPGTLTGRYIILYYPTLFIFADRLLQVAWPARWDGGLPAFKVLPPQAHQGHLPPLNYSASWSVGRCRLQVQPDMIDHAAWMDIYRSMNAHPNLSGRARFSKRCPILHIQACTGRGSYVSGFQTRARGNLQARAKKTGTGKPLSDGKSPRGKDEEKRELQKRKYPEADEKPEETIDEKLHRPFDGHSNRLIVLPAPSAGLCAADSAANRASCEALAANPVQLCLPMNGHHGNP